MKFVTLALALLLAVGSHAAAVPAEAPSPLEHVRAVADMYMLSMKDSAKRALDQLDDTQYTDLKTNLVNRLDEMHAQIMAFRETAAPVTDGVLATIAEATSDFRASVNTDIQTLRDELEPKREELKAVILKHIAEYREKLGPIMAEYQKRQTVEMGQLKTQLEPMADELKERFAANVEETKTVLIPMVESVYKKLSARLENLKEIVAPYMEEYKEQIRDAVNQAKSMDPADISALKTKIEPMAEEVKTKLAQIFETISATFNKPQ